MVFKGEPSGFQNSVIHEEGVEELINEDSTKTIGSCPLLSTESSRLNLSGTTRAFRPFKEKFDEANCHQILLMTNF